MKTKPTIMEPVDSFGFRWGPVVVARQMHDSRAGYILAVQTEHAELEIRVTPSGRKIQAFHRLPRGGLVPLR